MFFTLLFDKYYEQISTALLPGYKKSVGKIYLKDLQVAVEVIQNNKFQAAFERTQNFLQLFQGRYRVSFKPLMLPENHMKDSIKAELEPEWSSFFKTVSVLIDNHDFYKAIESRFQRRYEGIIKATEVLAKDIKLIADIQKAYSEAQNLGKSREHLIVNLQYLVEKSNQLFTQYYAQIYALKDDVNNYSQQTIQKIDQLKENLSIQVEQLITQEQSVQSDYEQFFLGYRLLIAQRIDPICDNLRIFCFKAQQFRSEFIEQLTSLEDKHPDELELARCELDKQFAGLLCELEQMQAIEQAEKEARQSIKDLGTSSKFDFFQEVAEEAQQNALRSVGDTIRQMASFQLMLQQIESIKEGYHRRIYELLEVERKYLDLRDRTISSINTDIKFSISSLNLRGNKIDELFVPESSYRLVTGQLNSYDTEANRVVLDQLTTDGMLLSIGELGDSKREPMKIETDLSLEQLSEHLSRKITELGISNMIGFVPVLVDESERVDVSAILFFCRDPEKARPELTSMLEVVQQGKLIYIRKLINILPLPSHALNELLDTQKKVFSSKSSQVKQLIPDEFLGNKLKLNFQGQVAQAMSQVKQKLRTAYLEDLKQYILGMATNSSLQQNVFLGTTDNLIIEALDAWMGFEESNEPELW